MTRTELLLWMLWVRQLESWSDHLPDDPFDPSEWMS